MDSHATAEVTFVPSNEGGRKSPVWSGYRGQFHHRGGESIADVTWSFPEGAAISPGESSYCEITFCRPRTHLPSIKQGDTFEVREGARVVANGRIMTVNADSDSEPSELETWEQTLFVLLYLTCDNCGADLECDECWSGLSSAPQNALVFASRAALLAQSLG